MSDRTAALDWDAMFRAQRTPWERPSLHPAYVTWRASGVLAPCRILLPGIGRSGEPLAMARDGFTVTGVDLSATAVEVQRVRLHAAAVQGTMVQADLLEWKAPAPFDAVYDQTCLCALPPAILPAYAAQLHRWLRPGGHLFVLFLSRDAAGGPPFNCPIDAMRRLFAEGWRWPDTLGEPIAHGATGSKETPAILTRL